MWNCMLSLASINAEWFSLRRPCNFHILTYPRATMKREWFLDASSAACSMRRGFYSLLNCLYLCVLTLTFVPFIVVLWSVMYFTIHYLLILIINYYLSSLFIIIHNFFIIIIILYSFLSLSLLYIIIYFIIC